MDALFAPGLLTVVWVGGGSLSLLLIAVFVPPLLRRKRFDQPKKGVTKLRD
jgi:hypothetical protein